MTLKSSDAAQKSVLEVDRHSLGGGALLPPVGASHHAAVRTLQQVADRSRPVIFQYGTQFGK